MMMYLNANELDTVLVVIQTPEEDLCDLDTHHGLTVVELYIMPASFLTVLILGLPLNLLSLWVFTVRLQRWTRSTVFLFNLTLADTSWPCLSSSITI